MKKLVLLPILAFLFCCGFNYSAESVQYLSTESYGIPLWSEVICLGDADPYHEVVLHGNDYLVVSKDALMTEKDAQEKLLAYGVNVTNSYVLDHNSPIVMIGDSRFTHMIEGNKKNPGRERLNLGIDWYAKGGKNLYWFNNIVKPNLAGQTAGRTIIISLGVNDILFSGLDPDTVAREYQAMLRDISVAWGDANLFFTTVNPICEADGGEALNGLIDRFNQQIKKDHPKNVRILDAWPYLDTAIPRCYIDTIHFSEFTNNALCDFYITSTIGA